MRTFNGEGAMEMTKTQRRGAAPAQHRGPPLGIVALVHVVLFACSLVALNVMSAGTRPCHPRKGSQ